MLMDESAYLAGVERNLESAKGRHFQGSIWRTIRYDHGDRLRALMAQHRNYNRERLKELPHNRVVALHGYQRRWWFRKRATGVAVASILCPLEQLADPDGDPSRPIDLPELMTHVRSLVTEPGVPHVIGVCAPSGFTPEAARAKLDVPNATLVLIEPAEGGGWKVSSPEENLPPQVLALFDPEGDRDKVERVRTEIQRRSADLVTGSLSASSLAARLNLPQPLVIQAMEVVAREDPELRITRESDGFLMYRGVSAQPAERLSMNVVDRIRQLFAREGDETTKINVLSERRAKLSARKDRLYEEIGKLETREADLLDQGRHATSAIVKRRLAGQLDQVRKDIGRQNAITSMLNKQIDVLSTDIHNLTLIQQGKLAELPSSEELTENAVQAEEMLETLNADVDLVSGLETGIAESAMSESELAILQEFEQAEEPATQPEQPKIAGKSKQSTNESFEPPEPAPREPTQDGKKKSGRRADPEAT